MNDKKLIILIKNYEEIYNLKHSQYSNQQRRDEIWQEIGQAMQLSPRTCRQRWTRIRENHRKALNLRKTKSALTGKKLKSPKFHRELKFLLPYLFDEEDKQSITTETVNVESCFIINEIDRNEENYKDETQLTNIEEPILSPSPSISLESSTASSTAYKRKENLMNETDYTSLNPQEYLNKKKSEIFRNNDALIHFFISMGETVKEFPLTDQVRIKAKLFEMVNSVEMKMAQNDMKNTAEYIVSNIDSSSPVIISNQTSDLKIKEENCVSE